MLNLGKLADIFLDCLEKNPLFLVENDGYPLTSSLLAFADAHVTLFAPPLRSAYAFLGLVLPLPKAEPSRPGVDHPPPLLGEGDLDRDIWLSGLPPDGVPGIAASGCAKARAGRPDVAPEVSSTGDGS